MAKETGVCTTGCNALVNAECLARQTLDALLRATGGVLRYPNNRE